MARGWVYDASDPTEIEHYAKRLEGRRVGELVRVAAEERQGTYTKGFVGRYIEDYFGLPASSAAGPDFVAAGVELKTVPLRASGAGPTAKERTFITAIDYHSVAAQEFDGSPLDLKTRHTLYVFYEWEPEVSISDLRVLGVLRHQRDELDELMLRELHAHVREMVVRGLAHQISEGDTWGVGAATKDAGGRWIEQPFSNEPARRRAFAYKPPYTNRLWQLAKPRTAEGLPRIEAPDSLAVFTREVEALIRPWNGVSVRDLRDQLAPHVSDRAKGVASIVSRRILGSQGRRDVEAFDRMGIQVRSVRIDPDTLLPHEDVSFPHFHPKELVEEEWESSELIDQVSALFFVVFAAPRKASVLDARLVDGFFWRPSHEELQTMARDWQALRDAFAASRPEERPQASETEILHVRPHGQTGKDMLPLPSGRPFVRSSFWLNKAFVQRLVERHLRGS